MIDLNWIGFTVRPDLTKSADLALLVTQQLVFFFQCVLLFWVLFLIYPWFLYWMFSAMSPHQNYSLKPTIKVRVWAILHTVLYMLLIFAVYFACGQYGLWAAEYYEYSTHFEWVYVRKFSDITNRVYELSITSQRSFFYFPILWKYFYWVFWFWIIVTILYGTAVIIEFLMDPYKIYRNKERNLSKWLCIDDVIKIIVLVAFLVTTFALWYLRYQWVWTCWEYGFTC